MINPNIKQILNCTKDIPKPVGAADTDEVIWFHHGGKPVGPIEPGVEGSVIPYHCDYCGADYDCFRGKKGKIDSAFIKNAQETSKQMRALGWRPEKTL